MAILSKLNTCHNNLKKEKVGGLTVILPDFKAYYKVTTISSVKVNKQKNETEFRNRPPHTYQVDVYLTLCFGGISGGKRCHVGLLASPSGRTT